MTDDPNQLATCKGCGSRLGLLRCAGCRMVFYCSRDHQEADWRNHKQDCRKHAATTTTKLSHNNKQQQLSSPSSATNNVDNNSLRKIQLPLQSNKQRNTVSAPANLMLQPPTQHPHQNQQQYMPQSVDSALMWANNPATPATNYVHEGGAAPLMTNGCNNIDTAMQYNSNSHPKMIQDHQRFLQQQQQQQHQVPKRPNGSIPHQQAYRSLSDNIMNINDEDLLSPNFLSSEIRYEEISRIVINDMNTYGLSVLDDFLGKEKGLRILNEVHRLYEAGLFKDGQLASSNSAQRDSRTIRGDKITWVTGVESGCSNIGYLISQIDTVVNLANTMKDNGKLSKYKIQGRTKAMVACYPGSGAHYVKHVDNPNHDGRVITAIYYLNLNWDTKRSGGVLRIFPEKGNTVADIEPKFDRIIFFWSDRRNPHEVQPAHRTRYAITVWYFDYDERESARTRHRQDGQ